MPTPRSAKPPAASPNGRTTRIVNSRNREKTAFGPARFSIAVLLLLGSTALAILGFAADTTSFIAALGAKSLLLVPILAALELLLIYPQIFRAKPVAVAVLVVGVAVGAVTLVGAIPGLISAATNQKSATSIPQARVALPAQAVQGVVYYAADLRRANFSGSDLSNVDFSDADLSGANFQKAEFHLVEFSGPIYVGPTSGALIYLRHPISIR